MQVAAPGAFRREDLLENTPIAVALLDAGGRITDFNRAFITLVDATPPKGGRAALMDFLASEDRGAITKVILEVTQNPAARPAPVDVSIGEKKASVYLLHVQGASGNEVSLVAHLIDTTEQKNLELKFAHSQKMQAVGQLAGGIAHDFNNLLTAMIGFCDLLLMRHPAGDQSFADIMQVKQNANRAANLVRQLLAFSRRQTLQPKLMDITDILAECSNLVSRLIGENIELNMQHGRDLGFVRVDQGQLEQVIINLAVNARDAMAGGGALTIRTSSITLDNEHPMDRKFITPDEDDPAIDGEYVMVEVIDTGSGIPRHILTKIFEPFFSTKEVGSGTGLGLATVYGIIKQTGGYIYITSKEGEGTTFCLLLKRYSTAEPGEKGGSAAAAAAEEDRDNRADLTGKGTILLVEDEAPVRIFSARALRNKGYNILEADSGETALNVLKEHGQEVLLIITDVIMPGMTGPVMIKEALKSYPHMRVVFISGYAEDAFMDEFGKNGHFSFLPKPYTLKQLASRVKDVIEGV